MGSDGRMVAMRDQIEAAVIEILAEQLLLAPADVAPDARIADLGLDSLGKVEAIFALEERFGIAIPFNANDAEAPDAVPDAAPDAVPDFDFSSVPAIIDGVARLVAQKPT